MLQNFLAVPGFAIDVAGRCPATANPYPDTGITGHPKVQQSAATFYNNSIVEVYFDISCNSMRRSFYYFLSGMRSHEGRIVG